MAVNIGILKIHLRLPENYSLKGKRQVLKSMIAQLRNHFNVTVAELEDDDEWQKSTVGVACISNNPRFSNEVLSKAVNLVENSHFEVELLDYEIDIIHL